MITGMHAIIFSKKPDGVRAFFRDVLGFRHVDAGDGWLIFALPPAELACHPVRGRSYHQLYLMCDDLKAAMRRLKARGAKFKGGVREQGWGKLATLRLPDGGSLDLYEPRHASPLRRTRAKRLTSRA